MIFIICKPVGRAWLSSTGAWVLESLITVNLHARVASPTDVRCLMDLPLSLRINISILFVNLRYSPSFQRCERCNQTGATVGCCLTSCQSNYHFMCARSRQCVFQDDKKVYCHKHRHLISGRVNSDPQLCRSCCNDFSVWNRILTGFPLLCRW